MGTSWTGERFGFKSPLRVVVRFLLRSRETQSAKRRALQERVDELDRQLVQKEKELQDRDGRIQALQERVRVSEAERVRLLQQPLRLPPDPPLGTHGYGARMIALAINLARQLGLRPAQRALQVIFEWLKLTTKIPQWTTIRLWMQRLGIAELTKPCEVAGDEVWLVDHSNQIGPEKVLVVLGVRASQLPAPGKALTHEHVRLRMLRLGTKWKREDMAACYLDLARERGAPRAVECDGAVELREGAECLKNQRCDTIVLQDFKHKAANFLEKLVGKDPRFVEFSARVGKTRCTIQQTELAQLVPPSPKQKARFMNLEPMLKWAEAVLWVLNTPEAKSRQTISCERLEDKLGWLREYTQDLAVWRECQDVVSRGVTFINQQGLFRGAGEQLQAAIEPCATQASSKQLVEQLVDFVTSSEQLLKEGERLPMSTEILESTFGLYKQLEQQHSKGGFTSLIAAFGALLHKATPESVTEGFSRVSVKDAKQWICDNVGETLSSKRHSFYKEFKTATQGATKALTTT